MVAGKLPAPSDPGSTESLGSYPAIALFVARGEALDLARLPQTTAT